MKKTIFIIFLGLLFLPNVYAHPGRTDSFGCHTCRTNCSKWGLANGEYHCHNGNSSSSNSDNNTNASNNLVLKSSDNSIKSITIDDKIYYSFYNIIYDTSEEQVDIDVVTNSSQATYEIDYLDKLVDGANRINIIVTAENGSQREYEIIIQKTSNIGDLVLELSLLGGGAYGIYKLVKKKDKQKQGVLESVSVTYTQHTKML